jgi:nitroreductase
MSRNDVEPTLFASLETQRAVRRLRPDPISKDVLEALIYYATRAPSGGNRQPWEFIVVTETDLLRAIGEIYRAASLPIFTAQLAKAKDEAALRVYREAMHLSAHIGEASTVIVVCARVSPQRTLEQQLSSIYPAVQNLLLAARGFGLGSVLTTIHKRKDLELRALLSIPEGVETVCLVPIGLPEDPERAFRPIDSRRPLSEVLHWQRF